VRTGLLRCYTSRVENGHTVPSVATLEKYAMALGVPLYRFFWAEEEKPKKLTLPATAPEREWGAQGKDRRELRKFARALSRMDDERRGLLLTIAQRMARGVRVTRQRP